MQDAIAALHRLRPAGFTGIRERSVEGAELEPLVFRRWWTSSHVVDVLLVYAAEDAEAFRATGLDPHLKETSAVRLCWRDRGTVAAMVAVALNQRAPNESAVPLTVRRSGEAQHEERAALLAVSLPRRDPGEHMLTLLSGDLAQPRTEKCRPPDQNLLARVLDGLHALADDDTAPAAEDTTQQQEV